ncbi:hypothetical protein B0H13DRAFT_1870852 [Mycena leptocephala]|nr:hypothetical protein B0H13DRAFT_1870852 [Mycena leptocephala]
MAGGTFFRIDPNDATIVGLSVGYFAVVSGLLAEATSDPMFLQAAQESTEFIHAHLYSIQNIVQDSISASAIDFMCCWKSLHKANSTTQALLGTLLEAAIENPAWQGVTGLSQIVRTSRYVNRGLTGILLQFNAVIDLSTSGEDIYGGGWTGPPGSTFSALNQTIAISALLSAISLGNDTGSDVSPIISSPSPLPQPVTGNLHRLAQLWEVSLAVWRSWDSDLGSAFGQFADGIPGHMEQSPI